MVRKTLIFVLALLALLSAMPISASAYQVYNQGNISTTYITYFEDIVYKGLDVSDLKNTYFDDFLKEITGPNGIITVNGNLKKISKKEIFERWEKIEIKYCTTNIRGGCTFPAEKGPPLCVLLHTMCENKVEV